MSYRIVKGNFLLYYQGTTRQVGSQPDGDSIWFEPDDPNLLLDVDGRDADLRERGDITYVQLRFEAIDALEIHYKSFHQHLELAKASRDKALKETGYNQVIFSNNGESLTVSEAVPHPVRGYIMIRTIDPFGRPVSFVFAGNTSRADGSEFFLEPAFMRNSVNAALIRAGQAYPSFYSGLPTDLRNEITALAVAAWNKNAGLWPDDVSNFRTPIRNLDALEKLALWPKLFRRLVSYFKDNNTGVKEFDNWLRAKSSRDDQIWIIPRGELARLHNVIEIQGNRIALLYWPEELVIVPR